MRMRCIAIACWCAVVRIRGVARCCLQLLKQILRVGNVALHFEKQLSDAVFVVMWCLPRLACAQHSSKNVHAALAWSCVLCTAWILQSNLSIVSCKAVQVHPKRYKIDSQGPTFLRFGRMGTTSTDSSHAIVIRPISIRLPTLAQQQTTANIRFYSNSHCHSDT